jgi:hypothetical protein
LNATEFDWLQGSSPKHLLRINVYALPCGDCKDTMTSSRRNTSEKTTLTSASVTDTPAPRTLRSEELQMKEDEFEEILMFVHVVVRCTTARYDPKFEPKTLMLLRRCVAEMNDDGKL